MNDQSIQIQAKDPLHGVTLEKIITSLVEHYQGFEELGDRVRIKCFNENPSVKSSLIFLRKTPWARTKVENLYIKNILKVKIPQSQYDKR